MDTELERENTQHGEGMASGSGHQSSPRLDTGGQSFSHIRNADHSRSHFGNVYNNIYPNVDRSSSDDAKARDLMKALAFEGMGDRLRTVGPACIDTCTWFLRTKEYISWRDPTDRPSHNGVMWIKGKAGTGKSTLMRHIHDHARKQYEDHTVVAFFFNGRSPEALAKSTEGMYRSIVHQLYDHIPRLRTAASQQLFAVEQKCWATRILENLLREAVLGLRGDEKVICHIDALDECDTGQVRSAVEFFEQLSQSATRENLSFSICLSSRYYPQITMQNHVEVKLDVTSEHSKDIKTYLDNRFNIRSPLRSELQAEIENRCSGVFLWVVLVVKMLKDEFDRGATRSQLRKTLIAIPDRLDVLYSSILESSDDAFRVAIRWMLFAGRALRPEELYFAIKTGTGQLASGLRHEDKDDQDTIRNYVLHVSRGLIEYRKVYQGHDQVQLIHESAREYLSKGFANAECISPRDLKAESHARMAKDCQTYLRLCVLGQDSVSARFAERREYPGSSEYYSFEYCPLDDYVCNHLSRHIEIAHHGGSIDLVSLDRFFQSDYLPFISRLESSRSRSRKALASKPEHSAFFMTDLISNQCFILAEILIRKITPCAFSTEYRSEPGQTSDESFGLTKLDLTALCGGDWGSPVHAAVAWEREDLVRLLVERGADVNLNGYMMGLHSNSKWDSPLCLAVQCGIKSMVQLLLDHGACPNLLSLGRKSALHKACGSADLEMMALLLSRGANVNLPVGMEPIEEDARVGSPPGSTALHIVLAKRPKRFGIKNSGSLIALSQLLDFGANVNSMDCWDHTPLMVAIKNDNFEAIAILLEYRANVNSIDRNGDTTLIYACRGNRPKIVAVLLAHGANVDSIDRNGDTALVYACRDNMPEIVAILLEYGANVNSINHDGDTALIHACRGNMLRVVVILLEHGANVNSINHDGDSALMHACSGNNLEVVTILLNHGADVNFINNDGETALILACSRSEFEVVAKLLGYGANVGYRSRNNSTALDVARYRYDSRIRELLVSKGAADDEDDTKDSPTDETQT